MVHYFIKLGTDEEGIRNRLGLYFYVISYLGFNAVQLVPVLASQRIVLSNQIHSGYYHPFAYYWSLLLVQIPIVLIEALLFLTPLYGLAQLRGVEWEGSFWFSWLIIVLTSYTSRAWLAVVYELSPNEAYADVLNQVSNIIFTKLCGYFIAQELIVRGWHWVWYISYFTYAFKALALNDIVGLNTYCTLNGIINCGYANGGQALEQLYTIDSSESKWLNALYLFIFCLGFCIIAFILFMEN